MDWMNWILEESSESRQDNGNRFLKRRRSSMDDSMAREREELDYVIALSLAEEDIRKGKSKDREADKQQPATAQLGEEEDELLARAIKESLKIQSAPLYDQANCIQSTALPSTSMDRFCKGCNTQMGQDGRSVRYMGAVWHPDCFCCHACNLPITDKEFSIGEDRMYHESCFREHHHPKCDVCKNFLPRSTDGVEFPMHCFWMQKYCPLHEQDGTPRCCSCTRLEPRDMQYISLDDGRKICLECLDSAIMDTQESQPLYSEISDFFRDLGMELEQQIPLLLVERQALNEAMEGEKNIHHHLPETRGICLLEEQRVPSVRDSSTPNGAVILNFNLVKDFTELIDWGNEQFEFRADIGRDSRTEPEPPLTIALWLLTGSILAHEMMHAWLRLSGYPKLSPEVEEGICQVMAHKWLDMEIGSSSNDRLRAFFKYQIEEDRSPIYGKGFKLGHRAVKRFGFKKTLEHVKVTGSFPL